MKKFFSLLTLALLTMSAWAATEVTISFENLYNENTLLEEASPITVDGITLSFAKADGSTAPQYYTNGKAARLYAKNTLTIAAEEAITNVVFNFTGTGNTMNNNGSSSVDAGTYTEAGTVGTWTGSANSFTITRGGTSGHARITSIVVTLGGEVVETIADPVITPDDGTAFTESLEVSIACATAGAAIQYSTDGLAWTDYSEPFTITETTKVYARATKGALVSEVVTANYTKIEIPVVDTFVTFNSQNDKGNGTEETAPWTIEKTGVTMACTSGRVYDAGYRIYKDATLTITSTIGNILKIEFDGLSGYAISNLIANVGNLGTDGNNGTWVGEATEVVFTAGAQTRATEIRVYVDGELPTDFVAAPSIPATQNFDNSITVEITNNAEGATVMYNTDGATWQNYTGALTFTETTTLQAKAVKGENESTVVSATYTKNEPAEAITTLAQVNALNDTTSFTFAGDAVVTAQKDKYLWLRDATGYGLIYGTIDSTFTNGQVLSQNWTATKVTYKGLVEYKDAANLSASGVTNTALAAAQEISALSEDLMNAYVLVKNVKSFTTSGNNITANFEDGTTMVMYNQFNVEVPTTEGNYTVEGAVGKFNTNLQLYIINIEGYVPEEHNVNSIAEAYELPENATFTMFDEMVVTYQKGNRLWIRDSEGTSGMIYGDLGLENALENGQVLTDGWSATYAIYNGTPEFTNPDGVEPDGTNTREAAPYLRNSITTSNVNEYIIMKGLSLLPDAGNAKKFYNATDSLVIFNSFNVTIPEVEEGKTYDVTGIVTIYFGEAQVYITEMTEVTALRGDVDLDGEVNIADVTALIDMLLTNAGTSSAGADCNLDGSVDISDVTALIDYLLSNKWAE